MGKYKKNRGKNVDKTSILNDAKNTDGLRRHFSFFSISLGLHLLALIFLSLLLLLVYGDYNRGSETVMDIVIVGESGEGEDDFEKPLLGDEIGRIDSEIRGEAEEDLGTESGGEGSTTGLALGQGQGEDGNDTGYAISDYISKVRYRIEREKRYPKKSLIGKEEGTVMVSFLLNSSGSLLSAEVFSSSGFEGLDDAAIETVMGASPYPPFPKKLKRERLSLKVPIKYEIR